MNVVSISDVRHARREVQCSRAVNSYNSVFKLAAAAHSFYWGEPWTLSSFSDVSRCRDWDLRENTMSQGRPCWSCVEVFRFAVASGSASEAGRPIFCLNEEGSRQASGRLIGPSESAWRRKGVVGLTISFTAVHRPHQVFARSTEQLAIGA
ncbi:hypothetical protein SISSUDRAFT_1049987 [Sistotremastrum suecicum HHB10207 ss-3]|uniref:Uncharacterized protein n=1 Tax=Sistotremastrum suecicum HHB10207 ss-3 TaxID=1314776 RepID=A0A166BHP9_9AGAM|nr:hypothetical protein SISSUDRAFT_1049987 [Sistotremastrum suecicum HHB10207 ss-3]